MQTINEDIKSGQYKKVYLLYGEESFLKQSYKKKLKEAVAGDDTMNYNYFEGKGLDVNELISLSDTMPFFSDKRLIIIEDSGFFKTSSEALADYLPMIPDTTCIVFVEDAVDETPGQRPACEVGRHDPGAERQKDNRLYDEPFSGAYRGRYGEHQDGAGKADFLYNGKRRSYN